MHETGALLVPNGTGFITNPHEYPMVSARWVNVPYICIGSFMQRGAAFFWVMLPSGEVVSVNAGAVKDAHV